MNTACTTDRKRPNSERIHLKSCEVTPMGVNSPVRAFTGLEMSPLVAVSGSEDRILDADGYSYIDFCMSWGALIHGHAHPKIVEAAHQRIALGSSFGITTEIEMSFAEKIREHVPSVEKIRFVSSGTEATMSAARLARGYTGRDLIIKFSGCYHGHADSFLMQAGSGALSLCKASSSGIPEDFIRHTKCLPFNDFEALAAIDERVACVIVEPIAANMGLIPPLPSFLETLREKTSKVSSLLIFDEVITGFRVSLGGAQKFYGIEPDLTCFGKIIGGGFPAAAFGGRKEIMDFLAPLGPVYQAGTLSGNPVAMEAGKKALELLESPHFYDQLEEKSRFLLEPLREFIEKKSLDICVNSCGSLFTLFFGNKKIQNLEDVKKCNPAAFSRFFKLALEKGIYLSPSQFEANFISAAHSYKSLAYTREAFFEILEEMT